MGENMIGFCMKMGHHWEPFGVKKWGAMEGGR
jgi:hypothetical protein